MRKDQFLISLLVSNHHGVLTRIAGLFSKRGFNIDSLTVSETQDPEVSRMTIMSTGDDYIKNQMVRQLEKLIDVKCVTLMDAGNTVAKELMLLKTDVTSGSRSDIMEAVKVFKAKVVDLSKEYVTVELTGDTAKLDAFFDYMLSFGITEVCRTGVTAIGRGNLILAAGDSLPLSGAI